MTQDQHIDKLLRQLRPEKAPEDFALDVMSQIEELPERSTIQQEIKPDRYFLLLSLIAVAITLIFTLDLSFVSTWISMSSSLINQFLQPNQHELTKLLQTIQSMPSLAVIVALVISALLVFENLIAKKISDKSLLM